MYVVRDKASGKTLHINPAPTGQHLAEKEVYYLFDPAIMEIGRTDRPLPEHFKIDGAGQVLELSLAEKVQTGLVELPRGQKLDGNEFVPMTLRERVQAGLIVLDRGQKIAGTGGDERVVALTPDEMLEAGLTTTELLFEAAERRLRSEVSALMETSKTPHGYAVDQLARQKASFSYPFRRRPEGDAEKEALLQKRLIYPDAILDEVLEELGKVQAAFDAAKSAVTEAFEQGRPIAEATKITVAQFLAPENAPSRGS